MPLDVINIVREFLGDSIFQPLMLLAIFIYFLNKGVHHVMDWIKREILEPYVRPYADKLEKAIEIQSKHTDALINHENRLHKQELISAVLQGKVLGGKVEINDDQ